MKPIALALVLSLTACSATPAQVGQTFADGLTAASCILSQVLVGIVDPASLMACTGVTAKVIVDVIADFQARPSEAGVMMKYGGQELTAQQIGWLNQARANATSAAKADVK